MGLRKLKSIKYNGKQLREILEAHELFFRGKNGGARADLTGADLSHADLSGLNFSGAILRNASLDRTNRHAKDPRVSKEVSCEPPGFPARIFPGPV